MTEISPGLLSDPPEMYKDGMSYEQASSLLLGLQYGTTSAHVEDFRRALIVEGHRLVDESQPYIVDDLDETGNIIANNNRIDDTNQSDYLRGRELINGTDDCLRKEILATIDILKQDTTDEQSRDNPDLERIQRHEKAINNYRNMLNKLPISQ